MNDKSSYISLYRRFRPQRFSEVVGQAEIVRTLQNAVVADAVAHAYLFAGERGIGKTSVARILARAVNCSAPAGGEPCNRCANCKRILSNRSLDILEIDGASNRGIDRIRRLREEVNFSPTDLRRKVYIIDEVHMLTNEAFNALLKTLEEPPPHAMFIFATTEPYKVPPTIISRCQAFEFRKIHPEQITARLSEITRAEGISISKKALRTIADKANGGMRDAIVLLEQAVSFLTGQIDEGAVLEMLGMVGPEEQDAFLRMLQGGNRHKILEMIDDLVERGKDLEIFLGDLINLLRDRIAEGSGDTNRNIYLIRGLLDVKQDLFRSLDQRIVLEVGLLSFMNEICPPTGNLPEEQQEELPAEEPQDQEVTQEPTGEDSFDGQWRKILEEISQERVAIAAFLTEGTPRLEGKKLNISFNPEYAFHKESLELSANMQYLTGVVRRRLGAGYYVNVGLTAGMGPRTSAREELRKKAELVCQAFDGKIVKEE
ncbi:MAG: DNA polymerase III subunit gamma/tau [Candidatus Bipolaricaulota bacterium]|nr:DNA polymerase III subunit gamma/tau [Candidatus Bipolaricaulota bacterium]